MLVSLSRVSILASLCLTNAINDFTFSHIHEFNARSITQDKYLRLADPHRFMDIKRLTRRDSRCLAIIIVNVKVQSLAPHRKDIWTDLFLLFADIPAITVNRMYTASVNISNFQLFVKWRENVPVIVGPCASEMISLAPICGRYYSYTKKLPQRIYVHLSPNRRASRSPFSWRYGGIFDSSPVQDSDFVRLFQSFDRDDLKEHLPKHQIGTPVPPRLTNYMYRSDFL